MPTIHVPKFEQAAKRIWSGIATNDELKQLGETEVIAIKSDLEHMRVRYVPSAAGRASKPKDGEDATRSVDHVASDETPDRMGDIIRVAGWDLTNFKSNPMLLWMHDHNHPIGRVTSVKKSKTDDGKRALLTTSRIHEDEKSIGGLSNEVLLRLVADGDLPAVSVGFQPLSTYRPESEEERVKLGLGNWGVVYDASDLLELSVVSIGANPNALKRSLERAVAGKRLAERDFDAVLAEIARAFDATSRVRTVHALGGLEMAARRALLRAGVELEETDQQPPASERGAPGAPTGEADAGEAEAVQDSTDEVPETGNQPEEKAESAEATPRSADAPADPTHPATPELVVRLVETADRFDASARAIVEAQTKLTEALAAVSSRLEEISRAAGAATAKPEAASGGGSPAGADVSPESRSANSGEFYAVVLERSVQAVREAFAKKN